MMNLATSCDEHYLIYTYVMVHSFLEAHPGEEVRVFLLHGGLPEESLVPLKELCGGRGELFPLKVEHAEFADLGKTEESKTWPPAAYYRLRLFDLLPGDVDRLLYLDGDIVIRGDLGELYRIELGENTIAACPDMVSFEEKRKNARLDAWPEKLGGLLRENRYFNSGVILMDVSRLRESYHFETYLKLIEQYPEEIRYPDQDLLNLVHQNETLLLDPWVYNCMPYLAFRTAGKHYGDLADTAKILHFAGPKPWFTGDHIHYDGELFWWEAAEKTRYGEQLQLDFLEQSLSCRSLEEEIRRLYEENGALKQNLKELEKSLGALAG